MKMLSIQEEDMIIDYIIGIRENIPEEYKEEAEAYYFTSCLLVPKISLMKLVDSLGGLDRVLDSSFLQEIIAVKFNVQSRIINMRLCEIKASEESNNKQRKKTIKYLKNRTVK